MSAHFFRNLQDLPAEQISPFLLFAPIKPPKSEGMRAFLGLKAQKLAPTRKPTGINLVLNHVAQVILPAKAAKVAPSGHIHGHFPRGPLCASRERASSYLRVVPRGNRAQYRVHADLLR